LALQNLHDLGVLLQNLEYSKRTGTQRMTCVLYTLYFLVYYMAFNFSDKPAQTIINVDYAAKEDFSSSSAQWTEG
jgi:hypothetical protein